MRAILILLVLLVAPGCAQLMELEDKGANRVGRAVNKYYCDNTDEPTRERWHEKVNAAAAPDEIDITCAPR